MNANPYDPPNSPPVGDSANWARQRRVEVWLISLAFIAAWFVSIAMITFPTLNATLRPRFGSSLQLLFLPVAHLSFYLWRSSWMSLLGASYTTGAIAIWGGLQIWLFGTVDVVTNPHTERLHSAYFFTTIPFVAASIYLASLAWSMRAHSPTSPPPTVG